MRQKIESFKKQIRREQLAKYFNVRRQELTLTPNNQEIYVPVSQEPPFRQRAGHSQDDGLDNDRLSTESCEEGDILARWEGYELELGSLREREEYDRIVKLMADIYRDLKRIALPRGNNPLFRRKDELFNAFHRRKILSQVIDSVVQAFFQNKSGGVLQLLSTKATKILSICLYELPNIYDEEIFLSSNLQIFLRCATEEPKYDFQHLSKVVQIMTHMIIVSTGERGTDQLFQSLNKRGSKFHVAAIFFNISKMPLRAGEALTQNFIIMMKFYLNRIEEQICKSKREQASNPLLAESYCCLTLQELQIALEVSVNSVNSLSMICFEDIEDVNCLDESLEVIRVVIEQFRVKDRYRHKLNFRKLIQFLSLKNCITEIKYKILGILDHLVYCDRDGEMGEYLIRQCEMLENLWTLRDDFPEYVMNIMCNLALDENLKPLLEKYAHNVFLKLRLDQNDFIFFTFMYNWLSSQDFEIRTSKDKLMVQSLAESEQKDEKGVELECMLWYQLARHNQVQIPIRILSFDLPIVRKIKEEFLSQGDEPAL